MTKKGRAETPEEREKRLAENADRHREGDAAAEAAVDRMITENVKQHGG